jgi:hypothetical protein
MGAAVFFEEIPDGCEDALEDLHTAKIVICHWSLGETGTDPTSPNDQ